MSPAESRAGTAPLDCLVVGAGPAGLTAATYLLRFHRRVAVVDAGASRARWIPTSHNCPGFPLGVAGETLLARLRAQAEGYGADIEEARIERLECHEGGDGDPRRFVACAGDGRRWEATTVILATGIVDEMPPLDGLEAAIEAGAVRLCAVCDAYEASDERIAVFAPIDEGIAHAAFLRTFSTQVSVLPAGAGAQAARPGPDPARQAHEADVEVRPAPQRLEYRDRGVWVHYADGSRERFDTVYPVLGGKAQSALAVSLGARCDAEGALEVDAHQQTSVEGLYAIGDVVSALNQISVAVGHAALAATHVHNRLPRNYRERRDTQPDTAPALPSPGRLAR